MRVLSAKLKMTETFSEKEFFEILIKWLKSSGSCISAGENLESVADKIGIKIKDQYCSIETFRFKRLADNYILFKLEHIFYEQTWTTEVIFKVDTGNRKEVFFHIDCSRDVAGFDEMPVRRSEVIRIFFESGYVLQPQISMSSQLIETVGAALDWVSAAICGDKTEDIPLVLITQYFDSMASEVDEWKLARILAGVAYVVVCNNEETRILKERTKCAVPFNGAIAIYFKGLKVKQYRKNDAYHGAPLDSQVIHEVYRLVTADVDSYAPTWETLHSEMILAETTEKEKLLDEAFDENETLGERLKKAKARISKLVQENLQLKSKNEGLKRALTKCETLPMIIQKASNPEFYVGEQHDLVVSVLRRALKDCGSEETRQKELLEGILEQNPILGNGEEIFSTVKKIFANGEDLTTKDLSELKRVGFEIVSEGRHFKLCFENSKYWFTVSKTAGDKQRGGRNLTSEITRRLSVYN